jgi:hypothetical protein
MLNTSVNTKTTASVLGALLRVMRVLLCVFETAGEGTARLPFLAHRMSVVNGLRVLSSDLLVIWLISCNGGTYRNVYLIRDTLSDIDVGWFS